MDFQKLTEEELKATEQYDYLRFTFADIHGIPRSKSVAKKNLAQFLQTGTSFCSITVGLGTRSTVALFEDIVDSGFASAIARPVTGTLHHLPWATEGKYRIGEILCETQWVKPFPEGPQQVCPRYVARKQLQCLHEMGYDLFSGFEAEFVVFSKDTRQPVFNGMDIYSSQINSEFETFLCDMETRLREAGVNCGTTNVEYGSGQFEFAIMPSRGITSADSLFWLKEGVKEMSFQQSLEASFMTKSYPDIPNNGLHFSHSIWSVETNQNAFYADPSSESKDGLSDVGRRWICGLLKHAKALVALCSPTVNCYRRLHQSWAPGYIDWGIENRKTSFRCKQDAIPEGNYFENRLPSGSANPYIVLAATVAAGIDGIRNNYSCPPPAKGITENGAEKLPINLNEALEELAQDRYMVEAMGEEFVTWFLRVKRELEIAELKEFDPNGNATFEKEREMYFKFL